MISKKIEVTLICKKIENKNDFFYFVKKSKYLKIKEIDREKKIGLLFLFIKTLFIYYKLKPKKVLAVNFISLFFCSLIISKKDKLIYYNFDFDLSKDIKFNNFLEKYSVKRSNHTILPSKSRLLLYKKNFNKSKNLHAVCNCFSKKFFSKNKKLTSKLKFLTPKKYFVRLGSFYKYHYLEELVLSTKYWKKNYNLIIAGKSYHQYFEYLNEFIKKHNLTKVKLFKNISYKDWFSLLNNAYGGFALYEQVNISHKLMGGTSQKLNNYIYSGIPSFVSPSKDISVFNNKYRTSILVEAKPKTIAKKVNYLVNNKKIYKLKVKKNIQAFKNEFNFEEQFKKVESFFLE